MVAYKKVQTKLNLHRNTLFFESITLKQEVGDMAHYQSLVTLVTLLVFSANAQFPVFSGTGVGHIGEAQINSVPTTTTQRQSPVFSETGVAHIGEPQIHTLQPATTSRPSSQLRGILSELSGTGRPSIEIPTTTQSGAATM